MLLCAACIATCCVCSNRQERERAVIERDRSEELAKRMTKSLKSRAAETLTADGVSQEVLPPVAENGVAKIASENGDEV